MKKLISLCLSMVFCMALLVPAAQADESSVGFYTDTGVFIADGDVKQIDQFTAPLNSQDFFNGYGTSPTTTCTVYTFGPNTRFTAGGQEGFCFPPALTRVDYNPKTHALSAPLFYSVDFINNEYTFGKDVVKQMDLTQGTAFYVAEGYSSIHIFVPKGFKLPAYKAQSLAYARPSEIGFNDTFAMPSFYALKNAKGAETNYIGLRDLAALLNGTGANFNVTWDNAAKAINIVSKTAYVAPENYYPPIFLGTQTYTPYTGKILIDGKPVKLDAITLTDAEGGGVTYYKLRDLGKALNFNVGWSADRGVYIETEKPYVG